jgi:hypothetical protein
MLTAGGAVIPGMPPRAVAPPRASSELRLRSFARTGNLNRRPRPPDNAGTARNFLQEQTKGTHMKYEIKEFRMIPTAELVPHPDAQAYPSDEDDRSALDASIEGVGVLEPLTVIPSAIEFLVIDGCGRLADAEARGVSELPCLVVACDDPRQFAAHKNAMGRKRSTGSRILCYLMANLSQVIEAAKDLRSRDRSSLDTKNLPPHLAPWTSRAMAKRLKVSEKDVLAAIQLVVCQTCGVDPDNADLDADGRADLDKVFTGVMCARTPVRRWKPAFQGSRVPADGSGRAATNHEALALRTMTSLKTVFEGWQKIPFGARQLVIQHLREALDVAPDDVRVMLSDTFGPTAKRK